jgi:hypothetical protein
MNLPQAAATIAALGHSGTGYAEHAQIEHA